jgi:hypothetical protein
VPATEGLLFIVLCVSIVFSFFFLFPSSILVPLYLRNLFFCYSQCPFFCGVQILAFLSIALKDIYFSFFFVCGFFLFNALHMTRSKQFPLFPSFP